MFCPKCGSENLDTSNHCVRCGTSLREARAALGPRPQGTGTGGAAPPPPSPGGTDRGVKLDIMGSAEDAATDLMDHTVKPALSCLGRVVLIVFIPTLVLMELMLLFEPAAPPIARLLGVAIRAGVVWWFLARGRRRRT